MKISYNWLKEYTAIELPAEEVAEMLTGCGLEVETTEKYQTIPGGLANLVTGKVLTCEMHPNSDHLHITTVDIGTETPLNIVCGASNVAAGQNVIVAPIGTTLYPIEGECFKIKKSKLRGVESEGMICAEDEIGIGNSHEGIIVLKDNPTPGTPANEYFNISDDIVFEIGLTPNRSDATSHIGVAKDLLAVYNLKYNQQNRLKYPDTTSFSGNAPHYIRVNVEDKEKCPRYTSLCIKNVKVAPSPDWLKHKLNAIGIRPINNIVDVTQFVLFEMGQPLHAFDADKIIDNQVVVKLVKDNTPFITLDGVERKLSDQDLMICNASEPMCIAGVFGGEKSGITEQSTNVFLESAYFNPVSIRKTSKRHGLKTDASFRYERGCDPQITRKAIERAALLIQELAGGEISTIEDFYPQEFENCKIELNFKRLSQLIGKNIPNEIVVNTLSAIGINAIEQDNEKAIFQIPTNKVDVTREADLIEEFLRIYGYNNIEIPTQINYSLSFLPQNPMIEHKETISNYLSSNGFCEVMNNSLTKAEYAEKFSFIKKEESISLINPLSRDLQNMRQTLLFGGLENIIHNINHANKDMKLYEFGNVYHKNIGISPNENVTQRYIETPKLALWISGKKQHESWQEKQTDVDVFFLKNIIINAINKTNANTNRLKIQCSSENNYMNNVLTYFLDNEPIIEIGEVKTAILESFDIKQKVFYAEIDCNLLVKACKGQKVTFEDLNKFPEVNRDLALLIDTNITYEQIESLSFKTEKRYLKSVNLFDVYQGKNIESGKKSYAIRYVLSNKDKTLTNNEITNIMDKLVAAYEKELGAKLRT